MTGAKCNNNCVFCSAKPRSRFTERTTKELSAEIIRNSGRYKAIEFVGGEFTIRPDAIALVGLCSQKGYKRISLETNGAMFAYLDFAREICVAGLDEISFSVHGARAATHDAITGVPGSHKLTLKGIRNVCAGAKASVRINFVVTKYNFREMSALAKKFSRIKNIRSVRFNLVRPMDYIPAKKLKEIVPKLSEIKPYLEKAARNKKVELKNFPLCVSGAGAHSIKKLKQLDKNYGAPEEAGSVYSTVKSLMAHGKTCADCRLKNACPGVWKKYLEIRGEDGLCAL